MTGGTLLVAVLLLAAAALVAWPVHSIRARRRRVLASGRGAAGGDPDEALVEWIRDLGRVLEGPVDGSGGAPTSAHPAAISRPLGASDSNAGRTRSTGRPGTSTTSRPGRGRPAAPQGPPVHWARLVRRAGEILGVRPPPPGRRPKPWTPYGVSARPWSQPRSTAGIRSRPVGATSPARRRPTAGEARTSTAEASWPASPTETSRYAFDGRRRACWCWSAWWAPASVPCPAARWPRSRWPATARWPYAPCCAGGRTATPTGSPARVGPALRPRGRPAGGPARPTDPRDRRASTGWAVRTGFDQLTSAAVRLADRTGAPLAELVERIEADARSTDRGLAAAAAQAAGARATAWLLAALPLGGIGLGYGIGVDPVAVLLHTPVGGACASSRSCSRSSACSGPSGWVRRRGGAA